MEAIKRNANGEPVHSFGGLIDHLGTMTRNTMRMSLAKKQHFTLLSKSTPLQEVAFQLLGFDPKRVQSGKSRSANWRVGSSRYAFDQ
jgi:hypothetical protein